MSSELITILFFGGMFALIFAGVPVAFALGGISSIFLYLTWGGDGFFLVANRLWTAMNSFTLIAIPLFMFMALILERTGVAQALFRMIHLWSGGLRGGLAIGTVLICAMFGAMVGVSGAAVVAMGAIALPAMLERKYDKRLALGCINAGGGFGVLIPPSIVMIVYAMLTGVSVGALFAAGMIPGLLMSVLVAGYIAIRCWLQPELGPALPKEERGDWSERFRSLMAVALPIGIVVMVLGSILSGIATATEAAAIGVLGSLLSAMVHRTLSLNLIKEALLQTLRLTSMIMWIILGAQVFSTAYSAMGAQQVVMDLMAAIPGGEWGALAAMLLLLMLMGMVLDPIGIMLITLPVFMPIITMYGIDPIWFGVLFVIMVEIGYMTPPFGFNLFYLRGVAPPGISIGDIYISALPYAAVILFGLLLIIAFPGIALWLPKLLF
ncbi:TRAP transporter large permease [Halomonas sp. KO116]|jgi:tripartite ATP-independent transporter DctM subunit|uniref:TRAP transporter large permease n=1 Tax=Halomonas sp. KO116 TaxID=1504981 RepID=UPI0004E36465|nr:TRAP transporter large permease subunit [Halomonas sp. KO116]AJY53250.1 TRAP dicarboxylate transporter, DctM subunit [Halomonas sp. KO116]